MSLDDRIYILQHTRLPIELGDMLHTADIAFLQDRDAEALALVEKIEQALKSA